MAKAIDKSGIQFRILNSSKGPAVRATRAQADLLLYKQVIRETLENQQTPTKSKVNTHYNQYKTTKHTVEILEININVPVTLYACINRPPKGIEVN